MKSKISLHALPVLVSLLVIGIITLPKAHAQSAPSTTQSANVTESTNEGPDLQEVKEPANEAADTDNNQAGPGHVDSEQATQSTSQN